MHRGFPQNAYNIKTYNAELGIHIGKALLKRQPYKIKRTTSDRQKLVYEIEVKGNTIMVNSFITL